MNKPELDAMEEALTARQTAHWSEFDERHWRAYKFERACEIVAKRRGLWDESDDES